MERSASAVNEFQFAMPTHKPPYPATSAKGHNGMQQRVAPWHPHYSQHPPHSQHSQHPHHSHHSHGTSQSPRPCASAPCSPSKPSTAPTRRHGPHFNAAPYLRHPVAHLPPPAPNTAAESQSESSTLSGSDALRQCDSFHVMHKVPQGDSPYVRAKHVQVQNLSPLPIGTRVVLVFPLQGIKM